MKISKRLLSIVNLINNYEKIIDIGCDHGLVDIYLALNKECDCICYDVSQHIIDRAICNINKYNIHDRVKTYVGNGFDNLNLDYNSTMILSGMGTFTILNIIKVNKTKSIICQTNTDLYELRKSVCGMGYYIKYEEIVFDNGRYYVTIRFEVGTKKYNDSDYLLGPILIKNNDLIFKKYVNHLYNKCFSSYLKGYKYEVDERKKKQCFLNILSNYKEK